MVKRTRSQTQVARANYAPLQKLPRSCVDLMCGYLTLNEKVVLKSTTCQCISFSMLELVVIHLVTTALFSFNPNVGLIFECTIRTPFGAIRGTKYALDLQLNSERMYLRRYDSSTQIFELLASFCGPSECHSYVVPTMSYFKDQEHANVWMKKRCLEIFHEVALFTAIAPNVFTVK